MNGKSATPTPEQRDCPYCNGVGSVGTPGAACPTCGGTGQKPQWLRDLRAAHSERSQTPPASNTKDVIGRLAAHPYRVGDPMPAVGSECLVSGAHCDVDSDQHRSYGWRKVIGYTDDNQFVCLQIPGCWPTVERLTHCWFAEIPTPRSSDETPPAPASKNQSPQLDAIKQALDAAAIALPVLFDMCTAAKLRAGAMAADEILGSVKFAQKEMSHLLSGATSAHETAGKLAPCKHDWVGDDHCAYCALENARAEIQDLRNHIFNGVDFMEAWLRQYGSTDQLSSETRQWCAVEIERAAEEAPEATAHLGWAEEELKCLLQYHDFHGRQMPDPDGASHRFRAAQLRAQKAPETR